MDMSHQIIARIDALAAITAVPGEITRVFASPELKQAAEVITGWMQAAGCNVRCDAIGNVVGRYEGDRPGSPALVLGSHFDTVRNAGRWDGPLGVLTAIAVVDDLNASGRRLPFAIEVVAFSDEEGTRFASTLLGSRAMAGTFDTAVLAARDGSRTDGCDALRDAKPLRALCREPGRWSAR